MFVVESSAFPVENATLDSSFPVGNVHGCIKNGVSAVDMHNGALAAPEDVTGSDLEVTDSATLPGQPARRTEQPARTHLRVTVNYQQVVLSKRVMTGLEIKQAAIAQGVEIGPGFQLSVKRGDHYDVVGDTDEVHVHEHQDFLAVAPDDNS